MTDFWKTIRDTIGLSNSMVRAWILLEQEEEQDPCHYAEIVSSFPKIDLPGFKAFCKKRSLPLTLGARSPYEDTLTSVGGGISKHVEKPFGEDGHIQEYLFALAKYRRDSDMHIYRLSQLARSLAHWRCSLASNLVLDLIHSFNLCGLFANSSGVEKAHYELGELFEAFFNAYDYFITLASEKDRSCPYFRQSLRNLLLPIEFIKDPQIAFYGPLHERRGCDIQWNILHDEWKDLRDELKPYYSHMGKLKNPELIHPVVSSDFLNIPLFEPWCLVETEFRGAGVFGARITAPHRVSPRLGTKNLYLMENEDTGSIKVGISKHVEKRLTSLQQSTDCKLALIDFIEHVEHLESPILYLLYSKGFHKRGEWFSSPAKEDALNAFSAIKRSHSNHNNKQLMGPIYPETIEYPPVMYHEHVGTK